MAQVLVVDDQAPLRRTMAITLSRAGHSVEEVPSGEEALRRIDETLFDLVVTDLRLEGLDGLGVLEGVKARDHDTEVLVVTAYGSIEGAVQAIRLGAYDYLTKPFTPDQLLHAVDRALERRRLRIEVRALARRLDDPEQDELLVGKSERFRRVLEVVGEWAESDATVLITGETGTGKDLLARRIQRLGARRERPFVVVNCPAIPDSLFESELFGHIRGAFSGATSNRKGLAQDAAGGTLFLDEVGELPLEVQPQLLRFLETGEVRPIGQNRSVRVDTRVIAATNRDLPRMIQEGRFREDLYYRLNVLPLEVPPLRERREDLPALAQHFLLRAARRLGRPVGAVGREALQQLRGYDWPGNVRELGHVIERAVTLCRGAELRPEHLALPGGRAARPGEGAGGGAGGLVPLADVERRHILSVLKATGGNQKQAAAALGISKSTLWRKLREYGVDAASLAGG